MEGAAMAKPTKLSEETVQRARRQVQTAQTAEEMKRALSIVLPAELGVTQARAAGILGIGLATLKRYQSSAFLEVHENIPQRRPRGGRHNETIPLETERDFLAQWARQASEGVVVVVQQLREALQRRVGAKIPIHTMYRMLARHGWRKVAPDTRHPKGDPAAQEAYKKNSRGCWLPPSGRTGDA
jgi:transposase